MQHCRVGAFWSATYLFSMLHSIKSFTIGDHLKLTSNTTLPDTYIAYVKDKYSSSTCKLRLTKTCSIQHCRIDTFPINLKSKSSEQKQQSSRTNKVIH